MTGFRSWAEAYVAQPEPINREAFEQRRRQRALAVAAGKVMRPIGSLRDGTNAFFVQRGLRECREAQARVSEPVLRAQLYLQRKGYTVFDARVIRGDWRGWIVGKRSSPLSDAELIALATAKGMPA